MSRTPTDHRTAVVAMAYGTPRTAEEIEPYYTDIRRGRPPTPELLAALTARYDAIGGLSPLAEITRRQSAVLRERLEIRAPGEFTVLIGTKHAVPSIEDAAQRAVADGYSNVVGLVLAPHFSASSVGEYLARLDTGLTGALVPGTEHPRLARIESWATEPALIEFLAADLTRRVSAMESVTGGAVRVLFTAHSLPERVVRSGDPYVSEVRSTAVAVAARLGMSEVVAPGLATADVTWSLAWQSAGRTPDPWIGPDIVQVIHDLAGSGVTGVIVCACGFVADHLEVLYDLDIEAASAASAAGLAFDRTASVNDDVDVFDALARRVIAVAR